MKANIKKQIEQAKAEIANQEWRKNFIDAIFAEGGKPFVERVRKYGSTDKGEPLRMPQWFCELLELIGDYRVHHVLTSGCAQFGKAQPLDAKVLTPSGWVFMGELSPGDQVIAGDGTPSTVIAVYPQGVKPIYRVTLDDESSTECCDEHLWLTQTTGDRRINAAADVLKPHGKRQRDWRPTEGNSRPGTVKTLAEIRETLHYRTKKGIKVDRKGNPIKNHTIPVVKAVEFKKQELPLDPYLVGALLGDGGLSEKSVKMSSDDAEIINLIRDALPSGMSIKKLKHGKYDYSVTCDLRGYHLRRGANKLIAALRNLGLMGKKAHQKFIPDCYKYADIQSRIALLQGLMDTDGTVGISKSGSISFGSSSYLLSKETRDLVLSLGGVANQIRIKATTYTYKREKKTGLPSYSFTFRLPDGIPAFRLERKLKLCTVRDVRRHHRYIKSVEYVGEKEAQCILIDHPTHLYVTDDYIVTHNTQSHTLLLVDTLIQGKLNIGWFYASRDSRNLNVPEQFYPVLDSWLRNYAKDTGIALGDESDRQNTSRYQVDGATAIFSYTSTSKPSPSRAGLAAAGGAAVSFTANVLFFEERSQWVPGSADPLPRRLDASLIPTKPIRELGTPGAGQGIELEIERASRWFYPHYTCQKCGETAPLDPKGCLLKKFKRKNISGKEVEAYLTESGRPQQWWYRDESDPIASAYIGCSTCGHEITDAQRDNAWMQCRKTGILLSDFLDNLPTDEGRLKVAVHISPLCRITQTNLAADLVRSGLDAMRSEDWQQQALGHASENTTNSVSMDMIRAAIAAPVPSGKPDFTLAGIDQGRSEDWLWVTDFYLPNNWAKMPLSDAIDQTIRVVRFGGDVIRSSVPEKLLQYGVNFGVIDNEPDRSDAAKLCNRTCLEMADQKPGLNDAVKEGKVKDGGQEFPCWQIRNEKFLKQVLTNFASIAPDGHSIYRLPEEWRKWVGMTTERSPVRHLTGPSYDPASGKWQRGEGSIDDLYYAAMFCEAALYLRLTVKNKANIAEMLAAMSR